MKRPFFFFCSLVLFSFSFNAARAETMQEAEQRWNAEINRRLNEEAERRRLQEQERRLRESYELREEMEALKKEKDERALKLRKEAEAMKKAREERQNQTRKQTVNSESGDQSDEPRPPMP